MNNHLPNNSRRPHHLAEVLSLGIVFSVIIAVLEYYATIHPIWDNRLVCALTGSAFGFPGALALIRTLYRSD